MEEDELELEKETPLKTVSVALSEKKKKIRCDF